VVDREREGGYNDADPATVMSGIREKLGKGKNFEDRRKLHEQKAVPKGNQRRNLLQGKGKIWKRAENGKKRGVWRLEVSWREGPGLFTQRIHRRTSRPGTEKVGKVLGGRKRKSDPFKKQVPRVGLPDKDALSSPPIGSFALEEKNIDHENSEPRQREEKVQP